MKIGELAALSDCDVQTIRYYEREGLIEAPQREASGYRRYDDSDLARLLFVRRCRGFDIPLAQVRELLAYAEAPGPSCESVDALLDRHIARVRQQLEAMKLLESQLVALRECCRGPGTQRGCAIIEAISGPPAGGGCCAKPASCAVRRSCA